MSHEEQQRETARQHNRYIGIRIVGIGSFYKDTHENKDRISKSIVFQTVRQSRTYANRCVAEEEQIRAGYDRNCSQDDRKYVVQSCRDRTRRDSDGFETSEFHSAEKQQRHRDGKGTSKNTGDDEAKETSEEGGKRSGSSLGFYE